MHWVLKSNRLPPRNRTWKQRCLSSQDRLPSCPRNWKMPRKKWLLSLLQLLL
uniref:Diaphanous related formin 1 n=1 Tax=Myotis myotis TaxID=51298 RepID=A0A7J7XEZ7_MYOMY|nr:diaphanous related formin 1 [Myotis myotis]